MKDVHSVATRREHDYELLVSCGHRRKDPEEERIIASLKAAADLAETAHYRGGGR